MLVFGDLESQETPGLALPVLAARRRAALASPPGLTRHAALVAVYLETSRIAQGCIDHAFARDGWDAATPLHECALTALGAMAREVAASWNSGFSGRLAGGDEDPLAQLVALAPDGAVTARTPEGFAFYALYPEAALEAARQDQETVVIGLRSIGMALAPFLALRLAARFTVTLRPVGHPFARRVSLHPDLAARLKELRHARFAIIDEGPGLSGSSFGAVADWLEETGVARERIVFYPGHAGELGPQANEAHRARWARADRRPLTFTHTQKRLPEWLSDLVGESAEPLRDISGGLWREVAPHHARTPANRPFERRKFLARTESGAWLAKFTGIGDIGARKFEIAQALARAGFAPPVAGLRHGFLVERWIEDARPISDAPRDVLIARIGDYLAFRARALPAPVHSGASLRALLEMARHNTAEALGETFAAHLVQRLGSPDTLREQPIATDNRMQTWEWLTTREGAILKTDAADHHAGHDLVGARDIAWDVAGAVIEFDLSAAERVSLIQRMAAQGSAPDASLLGFFLPLYSAFQIGAADMAQAANALWPDDARRWGEQRQRYATALRRCIETGEL